MNHTKQVILIGGGAAGYFCALNIKKAAPHIDVMILEKTNSVLSKVRISGGGRCNITNIISEPSELIKNYPRGGKELLGPFNSFSTSDTIFWFENRGVRLKTEEDGRVFPMTDDSQTIIDLFLKEADRARIRLQKKINISDIRKEDGRWYIVADDKKFSTDYVVVASGSNPKIWELLKNLGHNIVPPVPSLFTFNINDKRLNGLAGVSVRNAVCSIDKFKMKSEGPVLITHWGLSGPAILKLSSYAARFLYERKYKFRLNINWIPDLELKDITKVLERKRDIRDKKVVHSNNLFDIPVRLWERLMDFADVETEKRWFEISNRVINSMANTLHNSVFSAYGKSTFKEEFVTAGGVDLKEVDFKTMESKLHKNLFFSGEVLDIDALTGGFNFQSAWTTAWIAAKTISEK